MSGTKCSICNFIFEELKQFDNEDDWVDSQHEDLKDCVKYIGKINQELIECINIIENRFHHEKVMRRKILD